MTAKRISDRALEKIILEVLSPDKRLPKSVVHHQALEASDYGFCYKRTFEILEDLVERGLVRIIHDTKTPVYALVKVEPEVPIVEVKPRPLPLADWLDLFAEELPRFLAEVVRELGKGETRMKATVDRLAKLQREVKLADEYLAVYGEMYRQALAAPGRVDREEMAEYRLILRLAREKREVLRGQIRELASWN